MTATYTCRIDATSTISNLSTSCECKIVQRFLEDSLSLRTLSLLENPLSSTIMEENQTILVLSDEDKDFFLQSLKNPPKPNQKLKELFDHYYKTK